MLPTTQQLELLLALRRAYDKEYNSRYPHWKFLEDSDDRMHDLYTRINQLEKMICPAR